MMYRHARAPLRVLLALFLIAPALQAQTTPIQKAKAALEVNQAIPEGWTIEIGKTGGKNPAPAEAVPDEDGVGGKIIIDPDQIAAQLPGIDEDEANLPGVLYIFRGFRVSCGDRA